MFIYLDIKKAASERGVQRSEHHYLKRVVTGKDKDGSPQYRYLKTQEEVEAYESKNGKKKITHEKQSKDHEKIKEDTDNKKEKKDDKPSLIVKKKEKKVEKSLYVAK